MAISNMAVTKAVVLTATSSPVVFTKAFYSKSSSSAQITFYEADKQGEPGAPLGTCTVSIKTDASPADMDAQQRQSLFLVQNRMKQLRDMAKTGSAHTLLRPVIYRLFGDYVRCGPESRCMDEAVLSEGSQDGTATITAPVSGEVAANCVLDPIMYDGVNQLNGFLVNNSLRSEDDQYVHITEGFSESRQWAPFVPGHKYVSYVSGQDVDESGNTVDTSSYVFDAESGQLVQTVTALRFQKTKKAVLDLIIGEPKTAPAGVATAPTRPSSNTKRQVKTATTSQAPPAVPPTHPPAAPKQQVSQRQRDQPASDARSGPTVSDVVSAIAAEAGVEPEEMADDTAFGDLGIDSLMAISILTSLRNKVGVNLPPSFFMEHATVGEAKQALCRQLGDDSQAEDDAPVSSQSSTSDLQDAAAMQFTPKYDSDDTEATDPAPDLAQTWVHVKTLAKESSQPPAYTASISKPGFSIFSP